MKTGLLVDEVQESALGTLIGGDRRIDINLEALGELVVNLHKGFESVGSRPRVGEGETVSFVRVLRLDVTDNEVRLGSLYAGDFESDAGWRSCLNLEPGLAEGIVLAE